MPSPTADGTRASAGFGRVLWNSMSGAGSRMAMMLIGFALTPYVLASLGFVDFGLVALFGPLAGYIGLLDFGLGYGFVKFITELVERGDRCRARQVLTFGMLFYLALGVTLLIAVVALAPAIVHLFKIPPAERGHAAIVLRALFALVVASTIFSLPATVLIALHRMDLDIRNAFAGYVVYAILTPVLLRAGLGINALIAAQAAQILVTSVLQYRTARSLFGPLFIDLRTLDRRLVGRLFCFGGWTQATTLLNVAMVDAGRFLAAAQVGVASVAVYDVANRLAYVARTLPNYLAIALYPAATAADARDDKDGLHALAVTGSLYLLLTTTLIAGFVAGAATPVLTVWLGAAYPGAAAVVEWLALGYVASSSATVGVTMLRSIGRPELEAACIGTGVAVCIATTLLTRTFGIVGASMGTCAGWVAFALAYAAVERSRRGSRVSRDGLLPAARIVAAGAACAMGVNQLLQSRWLHALLAAKLSGLAALAAAGAAYVAAFFTLAWLLGALRFDGERIGRVAGGLRRRAIVQLLRAGGFPS